ncbi:MULTISPECIES: hypothetical protein [Klebsiella/Raoultella group]|uniref:hypothetical protein n=1 Tax=Klebsiella/Raoultella group TaxID=2890311 RepID=UPI0012B97198|nr:MULTISPECIES: hypothetical protein [Klebsiella/Raoultella group]
MKGVIALLTVSFMPFLAHSADKLECDYAKANLANGANSPMVGGGRGVIESENTHFKAVRPNGSYIISPNLSDKKNGMLYQDDKTKIFVASPSKTEFAVSDRIAKTTEQWANCRNTSPESVAPMKQPSNWKYRTLTKAEIAAIEVAVRDQLKDPESARFKHSKFVSNGQGAYCGMVNSKNSYGGYAGDTPFMVMLINNGKPHAGFIGMGGGDSETMATLSVCRDNGYF